MKKQAICFDLFHTLVDVGNVPLSVGRLSADILGIDPVTWNASCFSEHHDIRRPTRHRDVILALAHSIDPSIDEALIDTVVVERQARFDHALQYPEPGVLETLQGLRQAGYRLALISNASTAEVAAWESSPLAGVMDVAVFSCVCGHAKPESGIYHQASGGLGIAAADCVFVGDGGSDEHRGAAAVGMTPVMITRHIEGRFRDEELAARRQRVEHVIGDLAELPGLLEQIG